MTFEQNRVELAEYGYTIVRNFLSPEECQSLTRSFISSSLGLVFGGTDIDINDERSLLLFTDPALRKGTPCQSKHDLAEWEFASTASE